MLIKTKCFGEIDLTEDKVITFDKGVIGFEECRKYTLLYDVDDGEHAVISWLQSLDEPGLAFPVISPMTVYSEYNPVIEDELLIPLGEVSEENIVLLSTLSVPADLKKMTCNLKAPFVINSDTRQGAQIIVENQDYLIAYPVYDVMQKIKEEKGE